MTPIETRSTMAEEVLRAQTLIISTGPIIKEVVPAGVDQCQYYIEPATSPSLDRPWDPKPSLQIEDIGVILKNLINSGDIDLDVIPLAIGVPLVATLGFLP
jgi:hypothetical protein